MLTFHHYPTLVYALFFCSIHDTKILILRNAPVEIVPTPGTYDRDILCAKRFYKEILNFRGIFSFTEYKFITWQ